MICIKGAEGVREKPLVMAMGVRKSRVLIAQAAQFAAILAHAPPRATIDASEKRMNTQIA
jgi:hypothetical protein